MNNLNSLYAKAVVIGGEIDTFVRKHTYIALAIAAVLGKLFL